MFSSDNTSNTSKNRGGRERSDSFRAYAPTIIPCLLWASAFVGIKIGLKFCSPLLLAGLRFFLAGLLLVPFTGSLKKYVFSYKKHFKLIIKTALFLTAILYALLFLGMNMVPGAIGAIIIGSSPLFTSIATHFILADEKLTLKKLLSLCFGISGIVLIALSQKSLALEGSGLFLGIGLLLCSSISSITGNIIVAKEKKEINPLFLNSAQLTTGGLLLFLLSIPTERFSRFQLSLEFLAALFYLAFLSAAAYSIWFYLLGTKKLKVSNLNIFKFILPPVGALLSWIILPGESPTLPVVIGMTIISFSIFLYYWPAGSLMKKREREKGSGKKI